MAEASLAKSRCHRIGLIIDGHPVTVLTIDELHWSLIKGISLGQTGLKYFCEIDWFCFCYFVSKKKTERKVFNSVVGAFLSFSGIAQDKQNCAEPLAASMTLM